MTRWIEPRLRYATRPQLHPCHPRESGDLQQLGAILRKIPVSTGMTINDTVHYRAARAQHGPRPILPTGLRFAPAKSQAPHLIMFGFKANDRIADKAAICFMSFGFFRQYNGPPVWQIYARQMRREVTDPTRETSKALNQYVVQAP